MYIVSLVFFGFALRKHKDKYIPASLAMMLWFLLSAMASRPTDMTMPYLELLSGLEKLVFAVMTVLLLERCILRKRPLRLDWFPLIGTLIAVAIRAGWYLYFHQFTAAPGDDAFAAVQQLGVLGSWKDFILQLVLGAVAVWHIYWISRPRFIK